jgi:hypothetical protein
MAKVSHRTAGSRKKQERELLSEWVAELKTGGSGRDGRLSDQGEGGVVGTVVAVVEG